MGKKARIDAFQTWFLYFWTYCVLGWCYEVFLEVVVYRWGFSNRGFLWGPYLPVYGVGALLILGCLGRLKNRPLRVGRVNLMPAVVFLAVVALTTVVELIASYLLEWTTGWLWDYTRYRIQWQGRICLSASLRFGVGGMVILYGLQPLLEKGVGQLGGRRRRVVFVVLFTVFVLDCIVRVVRL